MLDKYIMIDTTQIEIQISKTKLILLLFGCFLFIGIGVAFVINPSQYMSFIMRSPAIIFIAGLLGILFFGFVSFFLFKKLWDKSLD